MKMWPVFRYLNQLIRMSTIGLTVDTTNLDEANTADDATTTVKGKGPRKAPAGGSAGKGRQKSGSTGKPAARPYKKVENDVLGVRITSMKKKIAILESKAIILKDRLEMHVAEETFRAGKAQAPAV